LTGLGEKGDIQIRDTKTGELVSTYPINTLSNYNQIEITPDSNRCIITTGGNKTIGATIELRNLSDYSLLSKDTLILDGDKDPLGNPFIYLFRDMIVDPVRPLVYVMIEKTNFNVLDEFNDKFYLKVYNYESMELVKDLTPIGHENENLKCFDVSDDGRYLAALNEGKAYLKVWDLETYELIKNKQLYDSKLSNPNDYWCEAQDIELSSIDNDLIYYSGKFPKINQSSYSGGIFEYYLSNNNIKKIEMDKDYAGGRFILFDNETRILNYNGVELDFLNLLEQTREFNAVGTLEYPLGMKTIYSIVNKIFIGYSRQFIGSLKYDSRSNVETGLVEVINISPNPTTGSINISFTNKHPSAFQYEVISNSGQIAQYGVLGYLNLDANSINLDISSVASGHYILRVFSEHEEFVFNVIKEE
ncbi:MAG: T9SS type A sorting domain-containing protein, partial [Candidatus Kapaibacterium sp.]